MPARTSTRQALTIWCNASFPPTAEQLLRDGVGPHLLIRPHSAQESNLTASEADPALEQADIAFGQPSPDQFPHLPRLKWIHLTSAGYSRYDAEVFRAEMRRRNAILTNSSSVYAEPCAQHVLAMMLALARQLPQALDEKRGDRAWSWAAFRRQSHLLIGQNTLLVGYGAIARRLVELLWPFRMHLTAVRRSVRGDENCRTIALDQLDGVLPDSDHVINLLPGSASTQNLFNASRIRLMKPSAIYYSIGRGATTDQDALLAALNQHRIAGAYLDVTSPEPLPPDDPLWSAPNCYITPHTAGGHADEHERIVHHFLENLARYERAEPLLDRII
jgi:phosphoglycerate dehydrogenase-like enzyme